MPELDWQRYLERRPLLPVAPLRALLATLALLLRRGPRLLVAALPTYLLAAVWLLLRDHLSPAVFGARGEPLAAPLLLAVDLLLLWLLVGFAAAVPRSLLTGEPPRVLPRLDRAERRLALTGLAIALAALALLLLLPLPLGDWSPMLFLLGLVELADFLRRSLLVALPACLLLALLAPLLPAAALGPGFRLRELGAVARGSWPANLLVALLALALLLVALLAMQALVARLGHVGQVRLLLAFGLPAAALAAAAVLQTGFAVVFARRIGWTSGAAGAR